MRREISGAFGSGVIYNATGLNTIETRMGTMASVIDEGNGRKRIEFGPVGARKRIRLGKATENQAIGFKLRIEKLESARILGNPPDDETARWVTARDDVMHG